VSCPETVLEAIATRPSAVTDLQVVPSEVERFASCMNETFGLPNFKIPSKKDLAAYGVVDSFFEPYDYMWLPFVKGHPQRQQGASLGGGSHTSTSEDDDLYKNLYRSFERRGAVGGSCGDGRTYFTTAHRLKLLVDFVEDAPDDQGLGVDLKKLTANTAAAANTATNDDGEDDDGGGDEESGGGSGGSTGCWGFFPLHSPDQRTALFQEWLAHTRSFLGWVQPFNRRFHLSMGDDTEDQNIQCVQDYCGEDLALYFAFLGSACRWLFFLGVVGALVQCEVWAQGTVELPVVGVFSAGVAVWAGLFTEFWKRREARLAMQWGMTSFEEEEEVRPEYRLSFETAQQQASSGRTKVTVVGGRVPTIVQGHWGYPEPSVYATTRSRFVANAATFCSLVVVLAANVQLVRFKLWMMRRPTGSFVNQNYATLFSVALSVTIKVFDVLYGSLVEFLVHHVENHRTVTELRDSKISKMFFFNVLSSFGSVTYSAFFEEDLEGSCGTMPCVPFLTKTISTILVTRLAMSVLTDNILPRLKAFKRFRDETQGDTDEDTLRFRHNLSGPEKEFFLDPSNPEEGITRYMDQVLMFGYMVMYVTVFPVGPFIGFVSNIQQIHLFGSSVLFRKRRPMPTGAQDIGSFQGCFESMAFLAMVTNSGLVFFSMRKKLFPSNLPEHYLVWFFFGTIALMRLVVVAVMSAVDDVPRNVMYQLKRQAFLKARLIDLVPDSPQEGFHQGPAGTVGVGDAPTSWAEVRYRDLGSSRAATGANWKAAATNFEDTMCEFKKMNSREV